MRTALSLLVFTTSAVLFAACVGDAGITPRGETVKEPSDRAAADAATDPVVALPDASAPGLIPDASPGVDATVVPDATAPFEVRSLPGLRLWLESSQNLRVESPGSTGFASWGDSSGRRHVAVPHNVNPPSVVANGIAGRPTVSFVAGNGHLRIDQHPDFALGTGDFMFVSVAKVSSGSGPLWRLKPNATAGSQQEFLPGQFCYAYGLGVTNGCTSPVYMPSTEPHVFVVRRKSSLFSFRVDGVLQGRRDVGGEPADISINEFAQPYVFIGGGLTMQVSEVVVIVGPSSDANVDALESQLKTKYAIP